MSGLRFGRNGCGIIHEQPRSAGPVDEVLDRGRRPFCAAPWCPFMQALELRSDLAKRERAVRGVNSRDQGHQPILGQAGRGLSQQRRVGEVLGDQPLDCATEALGRPVEATVLENPRDIVPSVIRPHTAYRRQPLCRFYFPISIEALR